MLAGLLTLATAAAHGEANRPTLALELATPLTGPAAPGDTLRIRVEVAAGAARLTSASASVLYETALFAPVSARAAPGSGSAPFEPGDFLDGQVYANRVAAADGERERAAFVVVSGVGANGQRPVGTGSGALATLHLAVKAVPTSGDTGRIWLVTGGPDAATYTESTRPGVGQAFAATGANPLVIAIDGGGYQPPPDSAGAGEVESPDTSDETRDTAAAPTEPVRAPVDPAPANAPPLIDPGAALSVLAGASTWGPRLTDVVSDPDHEYASLRVAVAAEGPIQAWSRDGRVLVTGLSPGTGAIAVTATDPAGAAASGQIPVTVLAPDLAPILTPPTQVDLAVGDSALLALSDLVSDPDGPVAELVIEVTASGAVRGRVLDGALVLTGAAEGAGQVVVAVRDTGGNAASALIAVVVRAAAPTGQGEDADSQPPDPSAQDSEVPGDPLPSDSPDSTGAEPSVEPMALEPLPGLNMAPGESRTLNLAPHLAGGEAAATWSVAGAVFVSATVDGAGAITVHAPPGRAGREALVCTAVGVNGSRASAILQVEVLAGPGGLTFGPMPTLDLTPGDTLTLDLGALLISTPAAADSVKWTVAGGGAVEARLDHPDRLALEAVSQGTAALLISVAGPAGQRASEVLTVRVAGDGAPADTVAGPHLELIDPPAVQVAVDGTARLDLDSLVAVGAPGDVTWSVVHDAVGLAALDRARRVLALDARGTAIGEHSVGLRASLSSTGVDLRLSVLVTAQPWRLESGAVVSAVAGQQVSYSLDSLVIAGPAVDLSWEVSRGLLIEARVEAGSRILVLDAARAVPGREIFRLEARSGDWSQEVGLEVAVAVPQVRLRDLPDLVGAPGDTARLDLADFAVGDIEPQALSWRLAGAGTGPGTHLDGSVLTVVIEGEGEVEVEAVTNWGAVISGSVFTVLSDAAPDLPTPPATDPDATGGEPAEPAWPDSGAAPAEPPVPGPGDGSASADMAPPGLELRLRVEVGQGRAVIEVRADEPLARAPEVRVGGTLVTAVALVPGAREYEALFEPSAERAPGVVQAEVQVRGQDRAGNAGVASTSLTWGTVDDRGAAVESTGLGTGDLGANGLMVHAPPAVGAVAVWLHPAPAQGGVFVGFDRAAAPWVEARVFGGDGLAAARLERLEGETWVAVPSRLAGGSLWAQLEEEGVYRLGQGAVTPAETRLEVSAYPNPFNAAIAVRVWAPVSGQYTLRICDVGGRLVRQLGQHVGAAGPWNLVWDGRTASGRDVASGLYLARVTGPAGAVTAKLVLVR